MDAIAPVSGIVLAGGRSSRFGRDKLAQTVDGRPLLHHPVLALAAVCHEVIVVVAPSGREPPLPVAAGVRVRIARDIEPFGGPLIGLLAGLEAAGGPIALLAGGDMPDLAPALLAFLVRDLLASEAQAVALHSRGFLQPMPSALRVGAALPIARRLVGLDERSLQGLLRELRAREIPDAEWRPHDPEARSLRDIDRPEDLATDA